MNQSPRYVIRLGNGLYVKMAQQPENGKTLPHTRGWRPWAWTKNIREAHYWDNPISAQNAALRTMTHSGWSVEKTLYHIHARR